MARTLWTPDAKVKSNSNLQLYMDWLEREKNLHFLTYPELWNWSVEAPAEFWESVWQYFKIKSHTPYHDVMSDDLMPNTRWFAGSTLNYAEHIFRNASPGRPAMLFQSERHPLREISWDSLTHDVACLQAFLVRAGIRKGDRVAAFLPNIPEASVSLLAVMSLGAVWSSCSPDFGANSVVDRFQQIAPRVLIAVDGYQYGGKPFDRMATIRELAAALPSVEHIILIPYLQESPDYAALSNVTLWTSVMATSAEQLTFEPVPFEHPLWVLYSSGTTGLPKAIVHSHGGVLLEHYKYLAFHNDVHPGEKFFWFSTTGWMMWNFIHASLLMGSTIVLYDGNPGYPDLNVLWELAAKAGIQHFGTSAPYIVACMKAGVHPVDQFDLSALRSMGSTGSPLPPEAFDYVYRSIKPDIWLCSMSGGTDVCTAFVGGCPLLPVYEGEIQCRALGCSLEAWDDTGHPVIEEVGEMVITKPMPCMPVYFWNDPKGEKYTSSYFEMFPGIWRHGDWVEITEHGSLIILGRSDATLNRQGVRIGTSEIYRAVDNIPEIRDSLIINLERKDGSDYMPLFVTLSDGCTLSQDLIDRVKKAIRAAYSPRHVPDELIVVPDIPYTISGKKMETPVKKILLGMPLEKSINMGSVRNPSSIDFFIQMASNLKL